jgi:hypothetical protein
LRFLHPVRALATPASRVLCIVVHSATAVYGGKLLLA